MPVQKFRSVEEMPISRAGSSREVWNMCRAFGQFFCSEPAGWFFRQASSSILQLKQLMPTGLGLSATIRGIRSLTLARSLLK